MILVFILYFARTVGYSSRLAGVSETRHEIGHLIFNYLALETVSLIVENRQDSDAFSPSRVSRCMNAPRIMLSILHCATLLPENS